MNSLLNTVILACHYIRHNKGKSAILLICLSTAMALPLTVHRLVAILETSMLQRANDTPIVIGPQGSRFDLVLHALYFHTQAPGTITQHEVHSLKEKGHALPIPLYARYTAQGFPVVGTTIDYFSFRNLSVQEGHMLTHIGDCVLGAEVATTLGLQPGDRLFSDPDNVFDLGGAYPLNMRVTGVLARNHSADDQAVFVDLKTAWIIDGIGHGHMDLTEGADTDWILEESDDLIIASPQLEMYTTITPGNMHTFHFHGDPGDYPLSAIIALPHNERAGTLLMGQYVDDRLTTQALRPSNIVTELLDMIVQLRRFFDIQYSILLSVAALFIILITCMSVRLRRVEISTMHHIGCSRNMMFHLLAAELFILLCMSFVMALLATHFAVRLMTNWIPIFIS